MKRKRTTFIASRIFVFPLLIASFCTLLFLVFTLGTYTYNRSAYDPTTFAATKTVGGISNLQSAVNSAQPGDVILVEDGEFRSSLIISGKNGTSDRPIVIKAKNLNKVKFAGSSQIYINNSKHITIEGFNIAGLKYNAVLIDRSESIRITRNYFYVPESQSSETVWVYVKGTSKNIRIDHNDFRDKRGSGRYIAVHGDGKAMAQNTRIDHNYFKNIGPRVSNGKEALQIGLAEYTYSPSYTVIEYNYFEECDGDPEIVSIKSSNNIVQYNTFVNNKGSVVLRHGNGSTVKGNVFYANVSGTNGVRVHGENHKVVENYFENLQGPAINIPQGNEDAGSGNLKGHFRAANTLVEGNVMLNNDTAITFSTGSFKAPRNTTFSGNIMVTNRDKLLSVGGGHENTTWSNNKGYTQNGASVGHSLTNSQLQITNPNIVPYQNDNGSSVRKYISYIKRLSASDVGPQSGRDEPAITTRPSTPTPTVTARPSAFATPVRTSTPVPIPTSSGAPAASLPAYSTSRSQLVVVASGRYDGTSYPIMKIWVNGVAEHTITVNTSTAKDYVVTLSKKASVEELKVSFENDGSSRDLRVDRIVLDGVIYESNHPSVYSTGTWSSSNGCGPGYKSSVWLTCPGYFKYSSAGATISSTSNLSVVASGTIAGTFIPEMKVYVDEVLVGRTFVTSSTQTFVYVLTKKAAITQIRIAYDNDYYNPPSDTNLRVDKVVLDGVEYLSTSPTVYSVGSWDGSSCGGGYKKSAWLNCNGYFKFQ